MPAKKRKSIYLVMQRNDPSEEPTPDRAFLEKKAAVAHIRYVMHDCPAPRSEWKDWMWIVRVELS